MKKTLQTGFMALLAGLIVRCESVDIGSDAPGKEDTTTYSCLGKTKCGEMTTCGEAMYYLKNCPDVEIDGDHDGIPCEDQLCGH